MSQLIENSKLITLNRARSDENLRRNVFRSQATDHGHGPATSCLEQRSSSCRGNTTIPHVISRPKRSIAFNTLFLETQRTLLRALRPQTRLLAFIIRADVLYALHGEIHGGVEHGFAAVFGTRPEGSGECDIRNVKAGYTNTKKGWADCNPFVYHRINTAFPRRSGVIRRLYDESYRLWRKEFKGFEMAYTIGLWWLIRRAPLFVLYSHTPLNARKER